MLSIKHSLGNIQAMPNLITLVNNPTQDTRTLAEQLAQEQANQLKTDRKSVNTKGNLLVNIPIYARPKPAYPVTSDTLFYLEGTDLLNTDSSCFVPTPDIGKLNYVTSLNLGLNIGMSFPLNPGNIPGFTTDFDIDVLFNLASIPGNLDINRILFNINDSQQFIWQDKIGTLMYRYVSSGGYFGFLPANTNNTILSYYNHVYDITNNLIDSREYGFRPDNQFKFTTADYDQIINSGKNMLYGLVLNGTQFGNLTTDQQAFLNGTQTGQGGYTPLKVMSFVGQLYFNYIGILASY